MKLLQIEGRGVLFRRIAKDPCRPFQALAFSLLDPVRVNIELLRKLGEGLFTADGGASDRTILSPDESVNLQLVSAQRRVEFDRSCVCLIRVEPK